jgi:hypothetical protein
MFKIIKEIAIQASRGGSNVYQIINQIWTNNNPKSEFGNINILFVIK